MTVIEYDEKYREDVKDLLVELEEYIVSIDEDHLDIVGKDYREKLIDVDLKEINDYEGKCFLAVENDKVIGLIMGTIPPYDEVDYLDYKCPRRGEVTELVISKNVRSNGIGQELMKKMEEYFISKKCEYILIDVFAYNKNAIDFYNKQGYHNRMHTVIKKIGK